jgi:uncharacterized protein (UPF0332 family)
MSHQPLTGDDRLGRTPFLDRKKALTAERAFVYDSPVNARQGPNAAKAAECLAGARSELANGRYNNAANRAYYAAYNAAIVALIRAGVGRPRWLHDEVQALFAGELIARRKLYPTDMRRTLNDLAVVRVRGDYAAEMVSRASAQEAVRSAEGFVRRLIGVQDGSR